MSRCPWKLGQNFFRPARTLNTDGNYRLEFDDEELKALAENIAAVGQLHPVQVYWTGRNLAVAAGYRTTMAVLKFGPNFGLDAVACRLVDADLAPILRLSENAHRRDPSTYETARYLYQLHTGTYEVMAGQDRRQYSVADLSTATGKSSRWIRWLIQLWRDLPEEAKTAWAADKEGRLSSEKLTGLLKLSADGGDVQGALAELLGQTTEAKAETLTAKLGAMLGSVAEAVTTTAAQPTTSAPSRAEPTTEAPIREQRLGRPQARRLHKQFIKLVSEPVAKNDFRGRLVAGILGGIAGEVSFGEVERLVLDVARQIRGDD